MKALPGRLSVALVVTLLCLLAADASEASGPTDLLRSVFADANRILRDPATEDRPQERLAAIRALFSRVFDFRGAAERALGRQWQARSLAEQAEFTRVFADFVPRGFVYWIASVADIDLNGAGVTVQYLGESVQRDGAVVRTAILGRGGRLILLDHDMVFRDRRWMVRDVTIDGLSLVASYRAQFEHVIRVSSYRELVERMRARATESPRPQPVSASDAPAPLLAPGGAHIEGR
ncbi:MAG TPA: ABC transporter substrate-binding protein [Methylomirabilota bacterium]|jgi:phospholipid transport system substrate-binding protein